MKTNFKNNTTIDQEINSIFHNLTLLGSEQTVVRKEKSPGKGSCRGIIAVFNRDSLLLQEKDPSFKPVPTVRYAFYPDTYFPGRLGSVAIYGENAETMCAKLKNQGIFFGRRIVSASVEFGRRPFVDVRLAV